MRYIASSRTFSLDFVVLILRMEKNKPQYFGMERDHLPHHRQSHCRRPLWKSRQAGSLHLSNPFPPPVIFRISAGKPSSFFPEDSFIDTGEIDVGRRSTQKIPPGLFWRSQVFIDHPVHLKFNVSLGKSALVGIYGRKGLPPSHTQVRRTVVLCNLDIVRCPRGIP